MNYIKLTLQHKLLIILSTNHQIPIHC